MCSSRELHEQSRQNDNKKHCSTHDVHSNREQRDAEREKDEQSKGNKKTLQTIRQNLIRNSASSGSLLKIVNLQIHIYTPASRSDKTVRGISDARQKKKKQKKLSSMSISDLIHP